MAKERTQLDRVRGRLLSTGKISRNDCLRQFPAITRLASIIQELEKEGMTFVPSREDGDYVYRLVSKMSFEQYWASI